MVGWRWCRAERVQMLLGMRRSSMLVKEKQGDNYGWSTMRAKARTQHREGDEGSGNCQLGKIQRVARGHGVERADESGHGLTTDHAWVAE